MIRQARRRRLGVGLLVFGTSGLALVGAALVLVVGSLSAAGDVASEFERQRVEAIALLRPASATLSDAATSASNASGSLTEAAAAAEQAARLTTRLADSFDGLASLGGLDILGTRPFGALSGQFTGVAGDARSLSVHLTATASSMRSNVADSATVATDLRSLSQQLDRLGASLHPAGGAGTSGVGPDVGVGLPIAAAEIVVLGLLAWIAVPALACIWLGWRLARPRRP